MKFAKPFDRRTFIRGAGASFSMLLSPGVLASAQTGEVFFASAHRIADGSHGVMIFNEAGESILHIPLLGRGHDIAFDPHQGLGVAFARRPGNFALAFDFRQRSEPITILANEGRHFYGHGVFSADGRLLYASENDFENAEGKIGIYDATDSFRHIGEFDSFGTGPHEILLHPQKNVLIIANGGIETHPDYGRAKLNIPDMKPSLAFVELDNGALLERHVLSPRWNKLSLRHMDVTDQGKVIFGGQYEGPKAEFPPLIGEVALGDEIWLWEMSDSLLAGFGNYVGSVAVSKGGKQVAVTLPRADRAAIFSSADGKMLKLLERPGCFGVAQNRDGFAFTSKLGNFNPTVSDAGVNFEQLAFDNHLAVTGA